MNLLQCTVYLATGRRAPVGAHSSNEYIKTIRKLVTGLSETELGLQSGVFREWYNLSLCYGTQFTFPI